MRLRSPRHWRPSAPLVVSFLALFVSLSGVGWAATHLPVHSVGNAQLQNFSVGNAKLRPNSVGAGKIIPGAVGSAQVIGQVQLRIAGPCTLGAMQAISVSGSVTCTPVLPNEYGTSSAVAALPAGGGSVQIATKSLPAGSPYLVLANAHVLVAGSPTSTQGVEVDCTLSVPSGNQSTTDDLAVDLGSDSHNLAGSIPLALPVSTATSSQVATLSCTDQATPSASPLTVTVDTTINAIQTASNS
jgi:hypothetical protein